LGKRLPHRSPLGGLGGALKVILNGVAKVPHVEREFLRRPESSVHDRHHRGVRLRAKRVAIFGHNIGIGNELAAIRASDERYVGNENVAVSDLLENGLSNWRSPWNASGVEIHDKFNIEHRICNSGGGVL
jgi:hypothetical protein